MNTEIYYKIWCKELQRYINGTYNARGLYPTKKGVIKQAEMFKNSGIYSKYTLEVHVFELKKVKVLLDTFV